MTWRVLRAYIYLFVSSFHLSHSSFFASHAILWQTKSRQPKIFIISLVQQKIRKKFYYLFEENKCAMLWMTQCVQADGIHMHSFIWIFQSIFGVLCSSRTTTFLQVFAHVNEESQNTNGKQAEKTFKNLPPLDKFHGLRMEWNKFKRKWKKW